MVLVDTSVCIDYLRGRNNPKSLKLNDLIEKKIVFGINTVIYQELLQGAASEKEFAMLRDYFSTQKFYDLKEGIASYEKAAFIYLQCRKAGITLRSTIDLLIAETAIENDLFLLHNDSDFDSIAKIIKALKIY